MQVDGEPWVQGPGELVILKSALKVRYVKVILIYVYVKLFGAWNIMLLHLFDTELTV